MVKIKTLLDWLGSLVAVLSLASVMAFLDMPVLVLAVFAVVVGAWSDRHGRFFLAKWPALFVAAGGFLLYGLQVTKADVSGPVIHILVLLLAIRLLSEKQPRDYLQIFMLGMFVLSGSSLLTLGVGFLFYLVALVFAVTFGLVLLAFHETHQRLVLPRQDLYRLFRVIIILPLVSLCLMLVFFMVLPRTRHPLWNFLNPSAQAVVGLSESVQPGSFARISTLKNLAFRAEAPQVPADQRYWRALVLNQIRGQRWLRSTPPAEQRIMVAGAPTVRLVIYPEPRTDRYLITLDRPTMVSGIRHHETTDQVFISRSALDHRFRYEIMSAPGADLAVSSAINRNFYLKPPDVVSRRVRQVAEHLLANHATTSGRLAALETFFRNQQLEYAQDNLPVGPDPIGQFLFEKKRGYCEFFASAYATLARLAGIPARLVGGYYGGEYNAMGQYYLVSEEAAHVWVEVFTDGNRWQRVDPSQWAVNAGSVLNAQGTPLNAFQQVVDSVNYFWIQAVVVFDLRQQLEAVQGARETFRRMHMPRPTTDFFVWTLASSIVAGMVWLLVQRRPSSREARILKTFFRRVEHRFGQQARTPSMGLLEMAERLNDDHCREFAQIYQAAVFRDRRLTAEELSKLRGLIRSI